MRFLFASLSSLAASGNHTRQDKPVCAIRARRNHGCMASSFANLKPQNSALCKSFNTFSLFFSDLSVKEVKVSNMKHTTRTLLCFKLWVCLEVRCLYANFRCESQCACYIRYSFSSAIPSSSLSNTSEQGGNAAYTETGGTSHTTRFAPFSVHLLLAMLFQTSSAR